MSDNEVPDRGLIEALRGATKGLVFISESDFPVETVAWSSAEVGGNELTNDRLLTLTGAAPGTPVRAQNVDKFLQPAVEIEDWFGDAERESAERFRALAALLKSRLKDLKGYRIGSDPEQAIYLVGRTPSGGYAGVSTRVVET